MTKQITVNDVTYSVFVQTNAQGVKHAIALVGWVPGVINSVEAVYVDGDDAKTLDALRAEAIAEED